MHLLAHKQLVSVHVFSNCRSSCLIALIDARVIALISCEISVVALGVEPIAVTYGEKLGLNASLSEFTPNSISSSFLFLSQ